MDPSKISTVMRWPIPTTLKGIRGFLGLTGYYRRFIRDYGKIAAPLTALLKKSEPATPKRAWTWPTEADQAFHDLKAALTSAPLLRTPDFTKEFIVECDASGRGLGAVLMQDRQPVAYFSKTLSSRWLAKSAYEKELMALVLVIQHWRPYLLGRRFIVRTDQRSLRQLLAHPLSTPAQQNWAAKLLGYDFSIVYKEGRLNRAADALSRRDNEQMELTALSRPIWADWSAAQSSVASDPQLQKIKTALEEGVPTAPHYELIHGALFYKGRFVIPSHSPWIPRLMAEFHMTPSGGHAGAYRTYRRLGSNSYWPGMIKHVTNFVAACATCQRSKSETQAPAGLLAPLPIPERVWEDVSMDFLSGLPKAGGVDCVFVVVDRLSKYAHFMALRHTFSAKQVADLFTKEVVRLHGIPRSIVSDRDPIFLSSFWRELFRATGTKLKMSSAYHPETDGQTEVLNRCLQTYLRCFSSDQPKQWNRWLSWAEYCYNTSSHSASGMSPFEIVYGRPPPTIHDFLPGEVRAQAVLDNLRSRDEMLAQLRRHLERAQQRMVASANKHRRDVEFEVGDMVFLKFRPYRQSTLFTAPNRKLAPRFFGPFRVEARIGSTAYRLELPAESRIHPVFHVSLLKRAIGSEVPAQELPSSLWDSDPPFLPETVLERRVVNREGEEFDQVLVKWLGQGIDEATWMDVADMHGQFPLFRLEDKASSTAEAIDTRWKRYERESRGVV